MVSFEKVAAFPLLNNIFHVAAVEAKGSGSTPAHEMSKSRTCSCSYTGDGKLVPSYIAQLGCLLPSIVSVFRLVLCMQNG